MNINITDELLKQCVEAGIEAFYNVDEMATMGEAKRAEARAVIETWEASRTPGQLERTNHALALELHETLTKYNSLWSYLHRNFPRVAQACQDAPAVKEHPAPSLELQEAWAEIAKLKADVAELNERLHERTQLFLTKWPRGVLPPWPVVKVEDEAESVKSENLKAGELWDKLSESGFPVSRYVAKMVDGNPDMLFKGVWDQGYFRINIMVGDEIFAGWETRDLFSVNHRRWRFQLVQLAPEIPAPALT